MTSLAVIWSCPLRFGRGALRPTAAFGCRVVHRNWDLPRISQLPVHPRTVGCCSWAERAFRRADSMPWSPRGPAAVSTYSTPIPWTARTVAQWAVLCRMSLGPRRVQILRVRIARYRHVRSPGARRPLFTRILSCHRSIEPAGSCRRERDWYVTWVSGASLGVCATCPVVRHIAPFTHRQSQIPLHNARLSPRSPRCLLRLYVGATSRALTHANPRVLREPRLR